MLERVYRAGRFDEAMARVKRELGPDAVILSSRQVRAGEVEILAIPDGLFQHLPQDQETAAERKGDGSSTERRLLRAGVPAAAASTLSARVRSELGREPRSLSELEKVLGLVLAEEMFFSPLSQKARVVALVGPTGVGKTTTAAKLAAEAALVDQRRVGLVSIDQYRVAGAEQLERYAELMGVPLQIAHDRETLRRALGRLGDADLVLVDTAGRAPRDHEALLEMADTLHNAGEPIETQICLAAATHELEMEAIIERLQVLRATRLTVTKIDETARAGGIVTAQVISGLPLAYFTTGQRVPEDIEVASAGRLASLLCGREVN